MSFARTKIQPPRPRRGSLIERPALETRLADALVSARLVLVSAAAGYGKTAALTRQIERLPAGTALAWVAADEDDDLHRLLDCLVAALEPFDLPWRTAPEALARLAADPTSRRRAAAELLNALDACDVAHGVIAFDDLHRVTDAPFFEFVDLLLERLGPRWTLAVATRHDPPLALARLRALGELAEFRQADLQFGADEARALAGAAGLDVALADALLERTQGWAAGLRLALSGGAGRAPAANDRAMFDFLASEVIDRLDPELRAFLLQTSVLPELTAARAAAVTGNAQAALLIERIDRLGLFVTPLAASEPTLKLHDLLREALLQRLQREQPADWSRLWQRAAAGERDPGRKLTMVLHSGDLDAAAEALFEQAAPLLTAGAVSTVLHLVDTFPVPFVATSPVMQMVLGLVGWARWEFTAMFDAMRRAEAGFAARGDVDRARAARAYQSLALNALGRFNESSARLATLRREAVSTETRVVVLLACIWHALDLGATHRVGPLLDELMDRLESSDDPSLWYRGFPHARINGLPDTTQGLQRYLDGALRIAGDRPIPLRALALVQTGWQQAWQHADLAAADAALAAARDDSRWLGDTANVRGTIQVLDAFLHALRGDRDAALAAAQTMLDDHPAGRGAWSYWGQLVYAARIAALFDDLAALDARLLQLQARRGPFDALNTPPRMLGALHGHRAWLAGERDAALRHWQEALADEAALDRLGQAVETRLYLAAGLVDTGRRDEAASVLAPVVERVARHGGIGAVLLARPALRRLTDADWRGALAAETLAQLRRWSSMAAGNPGSTVADEVPARSGPLSGRELEVLERIAAGDSNKLIARAFDLSPHTVKRHVANILDKLGVESRGQAAAWFLARG